MRHLALAAIAAVAIFNSAAAQDAATNKICACGKPVDPKIASVTVQSGSTSVGIRSCSAECAGKIKAMRPEDAIKIIAAHNKVPETIK